MWQARGEEGWIDAFLDIAHEQHAARSDLAQEHDRDVVDARPAIGWRHGNLAADRPEHAQVDVIHGQSVTGRETHPGRRARSGEIAQPRGVTRARSAHPRLEDARHVVSLEEERKTGDVILVRMAQHDGVDPAIPRRDSSVEVDQQAIRVRPAVDEQSPSA